MSERLDAIRQRYRVLRPEPEDETLSTPERQFWFLDAPFLMDELSYRIDGLAHTRQQGEHRGEE